MKRKKLSNKALLAVLRDYFRIDISKEELKIVMDMPPEESHRLFSFSTLPLEVEPVIPVSRPRPRRAARTRMKISASMQGRSNFAGKRHTAEAKAKISASREGGRS